MRHYYKLILLIFIILQLMISIVKAEPDKEEETVLQEHNDKVCKLESKGMKIFQLQDFSLVLKKYSVKDDPTQLSRCLNIYKYDNKDFKINKIPFKGNLADLSFLLPIHPEQLTPDSFLIISHNGMGSQLNYKIYSLIDEKIEIIFDGSYHLFERIYFQGDSMPYLLCTNIRASMVSDHVDYSKQAIITDVFKWKSPAKRYVKINFQTMNGGREINAGPR